MEHLKTKSTYFPEDIPTEESFWDKINISYSTIAALREPHCPFQVFSTRIGKTFKDENPDMQRGLYFESQILGATAKGDKVIDLPRTQKGEITADHKRIDEQVENFKVISEKHNIKFLTKQVRLEYKDKRWKYKLVGVIDAIGTITDDNFISDWVSKQTLDIFKEHTDNQLDIAAVVEQMRIQGTPAIFDIKLTKNINSNGDWSWKHPYNMPSTQPAMLTKLMIENLQKKYPFYYLVFDYSPQKEYQIIRKDIAQIDIAELENDIRETEEKIDNYRLNGWGYLPEYYRCKDCPLLQTCPKAITTKPILNI